ncbi:MAG: penicillin acylase family protein [Polyangia bacterium]
MRPGLLPILLFTLVGCERTTRGPVEAIPLTTTLRATGLSASVDVIRDDAGIPHIYGRTFADVAYAQGYTMAQDRIAQMDLTRRLGSGTLSEVVGTLSSAVLVTDIQMRTHHLRSTSAAAFAQLQASTDPTDQALVKTLGMFAAGVNAYLAQLKSGVATLPDAYAALYGSAPIAAWSEVDTLVMGRVLSFELSFDGASDVLRSLVDSSAHALSGDAARARIAEDLEMLAPVDPTYTLPSGWTGLNGDTSTARRSKHPKARGPSMTQLREEFMAMRDLGRQRVTQPDKGSNNFVIGAAKSATGNALVANDTHLQLSNPAIFYLNHLVVSDPTAPLDVMGVQFPGVPGVILGMNQHIAWGSTVNNLDVTDTYSENVIKCSAGGDVPCVQTKAGEVKLVPRQEVFQIGFAGNVSKSVTFTFYDVPNHGPITPRITGADTNDVAVDALHVGGTEMSVRWTGHEPTQEVRALVNLDRATTMQEAVAALDRDFKAGGQNWVIADDQKHIGWTQTCRVPRRPAGVIPWKVVAGDGSADWGADLDARYVPHAYDPATAFLATANADPIGVTDSGDPLKNAPVIDGIPLYIGVDFDPGTRVGRITKRIQAKDKLTLDDLQSIQADAVTEYGPLFAPTLIDAAQALSEELATPGTHPELTAIVAAAAPAIQQLITPAHDRVAAWTFDTPSGVSAQVAGLDDTPTAVQIADSQATAIVAAFTAQLAHRSLDDELSAMGLALDQLDDSTMRKVLTRMCAHPELMVTGKQSNGDSILFDDLTTTAIETRRTTAARALVDALITLASPKQLGPDITAWRWGTIHTITLDTLVPIAALAIPPATDPAFPSGFPRHGDDGTVDVGPHGLSTSIFSYAHGPAIRFVAELTPDGPVARNVMPGGQVFDPTSPHYRDLMELWRVNQTVDLAYKIADVLASAKREYSANPKGPRAGRIRFAP